jgi:hypothetical protein
VIRMGRVPPGIQGLPWLVCGHSNPLTGALSKLSVLQPLLNLRFPPRDFVDGYPTPLGKLARAFHAPHS